MAKSTVVRNGRSVGDRRELSPIERPLLDVSAASIQLGCSERFVRRLVQERRIPFVKLAGTKVRFVATDLDDWVTRQRVWHAE